jgi:hypothetical protein
MNIRFEKRLRKMLQESTGQEKVKKLLNEALAGDETACRTSYQDNEKFTLACVYGCIPSTGTYKASFLIPGQQKQPVVVANAKQPVTSGGVTYKQVVISEPLTDGSMYVYMVDDNLQNYMSYNDQGQTKMWYAKKACGDLIQSVNPQLSTDMNNMIAQIEGAGGQVKKYGDCLADKSSLAQGWRAMKISDYLASDTFKQVPNFAALATQFDKQRSSPAMICVKGGAVQLKQNQSDQAIAYWESQGYLKGPCSLNNGPKGESPINCQSYDLSNATFNPKGYKDFTQGQYFVHKYIAKPGEEYLKKMKELSEKGQFDKESCKVFFQNYVEAFNKKVVVAQPLMQDLLGMADGCKNMNYSYKTMGIFGGLDKKVEAIQYNAKVADRFGNVTDYSLALDAGSTGKGGGVQESFKDRELKNLIHESLLDIKRTKKKIDLGENKIIKNRFNILSENRVIKTKSQKQKLFQELFVETAYLNSQGYDTYFINETFLDTLKGLFGTAADSTLQYFKEQIAKWLIEKLTPMDPNGWMANIIVVAVGNVPIGEITRLTECNYLSDVLTKSIVEGAVNKYKNEAGMEGAFYDILRNGIIEMLEDTKFGQTVETAIGKLVCPLLGGVADKMKNMGDSMKKGALSLT